MTRPMTLDERREMIFDALTEALTRYLYDDRKTDVNMPEGFIEDAVQNLDVTISELALHVHEFFRHRIPVAPRIAIEPRKN